MLSAHDQQGTLVIAWEVSRDQGPFFCPECQRQVAVKQGQYVMHHFAHLSGSNCTYGTGPDIIFRWNEELYVVIELQRSSLPPADVARRTSHYEGKGIAVLWVSLPRNRFWPGVRCSTKIWERFLHELYDDKIYCWHAGQQLLSTHLDPYILRRERYNKRTGTWHVKEILHLSRRSRVPSYDGTVCITDMRVIEVLPQQRGQFALPKARLWSL